MIIKLDGKGWKAQYFRARRPKRRTKGRVTEMSTLLMDDGLTAGAAQSSYNDEHWFDAAVPSDVRDILFKNDKIPDPYYGRNSDATAWAVDYEWWYRRRFRVPATHQGKRIRIVFKGVDLLADYYLNGNLIGSSNDMFVHQIFEVTGQVNFAGDNLLAVRIRPQPKCVPATFWGGEIPERAHYHKAQVCWGWDWAREMVSMGIWDGVHVEIADKLFIEDFFLEACPQNRGRAMLNVEVKSNSVAGFNGEIRLDVFERDSGKRIVRKICRDYPFKRGENIVKMTLPLKNARYWYPNGYGQQPLYGARLTVSDAAGELTVKESSFGVRKIKMLPNTNAPAGSYNLVFTVNGARIFAMGANWSPVDLLFARVDADRYEYLVKKAADLGFNMFRVCGVGLIEKEAFYDCCDRHGILVWQEFPLSCANYPKDAEFVREKEKEADSVIRRLRNHPSIALYCGGNEIFYYGESSKSPVLQMFRKKVAQLHPAIDYHYSSPDKEREGERDHGPWTYIEKHHSFWNKHFRNFASELGCNACLSYENLRKFASDDDIRRRSPVLRHHFVNLDDFKAPPFHSYTGVTLFNCRTDEELIFASQFVQADTLAYIMGKYRSNAWRSSGALYWCYNSAWPEGTWSIIDYYGTPKLAYSFLKETCAPSAVHIEDDDWELRGNDILRFKVHFLGDYFRKDKKHKVVFSMINKTGKVCHQESRVLESGMEVMIPLGKKVLGLKDKFFRLNASVPLDLSGVVERNQFYALNLWKDAVVKDMRASVSRFIKKRF